MKLKIKRFDTTLPLPEYQTAGSVALDLYSRVDIILPPQTVTKVPLNIAIELPPGHWALLAARSSLHKKGLIVANGIGVGDADFSGDTDEYQAALYNLSTQEVSLPKGERILQLLVLPYTRVEVEAVEKLGNQDRGGFGSTGK